eukprot:TRINITY_DN1161_c0_g1_i1.p1 TRINITY_DN1161_c0_g1~~TRINITY_DN1161_c0_g1_i1.p1  ORF type:complete len:389 (-),score=135.05 TRINITY_DN1161_c0_g1_i1:18-1184(-)
MEFLKSIPELQDKQKVQYLYSRFKNPEDDPKYQEKMNFWVRAVETAIKSMNLFRVDPEQLRVAFKTDGLHPDGMENVLQEMEKRKIIQKTADFAVEKTWSGWIYDVVIKNNLPSWFAAQDVEGSFVVVERVKDRAERLLKENQHKTLLESDLLQSKDMASDELELIKLYLERTKKGVCFTAKDDHKAIKFSSEVHDEDHHIIQFRLVKRKLKQQIKELESSIEKFQNMAKSYCQKKQKEMALSYLKRKKRCETLLNKKIAEQDNIRQIVEQIDAAKSNKEILDAYKLGTQTIKAVNEKYGLTKEAIDDVMLDLEEVFADQREIDDALQATPATDFDEDELNKELEMLEEEDLLERLEQLTPRSPEKVNTPERTVIPSPTKEKKVAVAL